jgi:hypothetical protein
MFTYLRNLSATLALLVVSAIIYIVLQPSFSNAFSGYEEIFILGNAFVFLTITSIVLHYNKNKEFQDAGVFFKVFYFIFCLVTPVLLSALCWGFLYQISIGFNYNLWSLGAQSAYLVDYYLRVLIYLAGIIFTAKFIGKNWKVILNSRFEIKKLELILILVFVTLCIGGFGRSILSTWFFLEV